MGALLMFSCSQMELLVVRKQNLCSQKRQPSIRVCASRPPLCNLMGCSPPGSCVPGILQAKILELVAMPSSRGSSQPRDRGLTLLSQLCRDPAVGVRNAEEARGACLPSR